MNLVNFSNLSPAVMTAPDTGRGVFLSAIPPTGLRENFNNIVSILNVTSGSAIAEGPRDVLVSRHSATTKYRYRVALFA